MSAISKLEEEIDMENDRIENLETRRQRTGGGTVKSILLIALFGPVVVLLGLLLAGLAWGLIMKLLVDWWPRAADLPITGL